MFVVEANVLLPHPPRVVTRVVERLHVLPRWCAGMRRVRHAAPADGDASSSDCVLTYVVGEVRLSLAAHTVAAAPDHPVQHVAEGDGVRVTWTFAADPEAPGAPGATGSAWSTRLHARIGIEVDPAHPTAAMRATLCRLVARRAPADLERLRVLLARYEYGKRRFADGVAAPVPTSVS
jgi:hypothetical protein